MTKLAACLLNISEARNAQLVEKIARAACIKPTTNKTESVVLNIFSDLVYNRSVISIAGKLLFELSMLLSAFRKCKEVHSGHIQDHFVDICYYILIILKFLDSFWTLLTFFKDFV